MVAAISICMIIITITTIIREWLIDSSLYGSTHVSPQLLLQGG